MVASSRLCLKHWPLHTLRTVCVRLPERRSLPLGDGGPPPPAPPALPQAEQVYPEYVVYYHRVPMRWQYRNAKGKWQPFRPEHQKVICNAHRSGVAEVSLLLDGRRCLVPLHHAPTRTHTWSPAKAAAQGQSPGASPRRLACRRRLPRVLHVCCGVPACPREMPTVRSPVRTNAANAGSHGHPPHPPHTPHPRAQGTSTSTSRSAESGSTRHSCSGRRRGRTTSPSLRTWT